MKFNTLDGKLVKGVKKNCRPFATYGLDLKITKICTVSYWTSNFIIKNIFT